MNEYKLTEPSAVLAELNEAIEDDFFSVIQSKGCIKYWGDVLDNLTESQYSEYISWSNIEKFESIHYLEAIFLLLGLQQDFYLNTKSSIYTTALIAKTVQTMVSGEYLQIQLSVRRLKEVIKTGYLMNHMGEVEVIILMSPPLLSGL